MPTDQERMDAYNACVKSYVAKENKIGIDFIWNAVSGDLVGAGYAWAELALIENPGCINLLTLEQQKKVLREHQPDPNDNPHWIQNNR